MAAAKTVLVVIADGSEEFEAVGIIDVMRRAGAEVTVASIGAEKSVKASRGVTLVADELLSNCASKEYDCIALPGGLKGAENLHDNTELTAMLKKQKEAKRWIAAICASPALVLEPHGLLDGEFAVSYPTLMNKMKNRGTGRVCVSNNIVTSVGPSSTLEMAVKLVELLYTPEASKTVQEALLMQPMAAVVV